MENGLHLSVVWLLNIFFLLCGQLLLVRAAYTDLRERIIENGISIGLLLLGIGETVMEALGVPMILFTTANPSAPNAAIRLGVCPVLFLYLLYAYRRRQIGGGDLKLLPTLLLYAGPAAFAELLCIGFVVMPVLRNRLPAGMDRGGLIPLGGVTVWGLLPAAGVHFLLLWG